MDSNYSGLYLLTEEVMKENYTKTRGGDDGGGEGRRRHEGMRRLTNPVEGKQDCDLFL